MRIFYTCLLKHLMFIFRHHIRRSGQMIKTKQYLLFLIMLTLLFTFFYCVEEDFETIEASCNYEYEYYDELTLVYPGDCDIYVKTQDGTQIFRDYEPVIGNNPDPTELDYFFLLREGTSKNLLIDFMGGGACWDGSNCLDYPTNLNWDDIKDIKLALDINPDLLYDEIGGIVNHLNEDNPFKDWTLLFLPYTTGDIHWGSNDQVYVNEEGQSIPVHHRGFENFLSVLRYIKDTYPPDSIDKILVTGQSAGSYGAIFNFPYIKETYNQSIVHVLGDGGNGVLADDFLNYAVASWQFDNNLADWISGIDPATIKDKTIGEFYYHIANYYPQSNVAQYTTMYDHNQRFFYYVSLEIDNPDAWKDIEGGNGYYVPDDITCDWRSRMLEEVDISNVAQNYYYYIAPGRVHTITTEDAMYDVEADGVNFVDWLVWFVNDDPQLRDVVCTDCDPPITEESSPNPISCP